ncbi:MAG: helix-turn-helix domain-containing protein [Bacteroidota bacterium]
MHLGLKIKIVRIARGLSQQELADLIHKTRPLISHIEQTGNVNERTYEAICKALKVSPDEVEHFVSEPKYSYKGKKNLSDELKDEISTLRDEIKALRDIIQSQKEIIEMLKASQQKKR